MISLQLAIVNINEYPDALTLKINRNEFPAHADCRANLVITWGKRQFEKGLFHGAVVFFFFKGWSNGEDEGIFKGQR